MSYELTMLGLKQQNLSSSEKHVLTILCIRANDKNECWPSVKSIMSDTKLDRKTILKALQSLADKKLIEKTGQMKGRTKSVPVFRLNLSSTKIGTSSLTSGPKFPTSGPKNGTPKRSQNWDMEYKDRNIKRNVDSLSFYQEYISKIRADKNLGLIHKETIEPTFEQWFKSFDIKNV